MPDFRKVTEDFSVAPQPAPADMAAAAAQGFRQVINNRPDGESPDQPPSAEMELAARAAGLAYVHLPIRGMPTADQAQAVAEAAAGQPTLAFCRSGTRSIAAWSLGQALQGLRPRRELIELCAAAGYDMSGLLGG
jgi:uncharacterized protein (TIGR01244 family)